MDRYTQKLPSRIAALVCAVAILVACNSHYPVSPASQTRDTTAEVAAQPNSGTLYPKLPIRFVQSPALANTQFAREFASDFHVLGTSYFATISSRGVALLAEDAKSSQPVQLEWLGADVASKATGTEELAPAHFLRGSTHLTGDVNLPSYQKIRYDDIYPGIDLKFYEQQGELEFDFVVAPGIDPAEIRIAVHGNGAPVLNTDGAVLLTGSEDGPKLNPPIAWQQADAGERVQVAAHFEPRGSSELGIRVGDYDSSRELVIDPVITYSSLYGGHGSFETITAMALDDAGNIYIGGNTGAVDFPLVNPLQSDLGGPNQVQPAVGGDAFVAKLDPTGKTVLFSTYLGGTASDFLTGLAVGADQSIYVTGYTFGLARSVDGEIVQEGSDFPTTEGSFLDSVPYQACESGGFDCGTGYVARLSPTGDELVYSTFLNGSKQDEPQSLAVDSNGRAIVVGSTASEDFPQSGSDPAEHAGFRDAFVTVLSPTGTALEFSRLLGGGGWDVGHAVALSQSTIVVAGSTQSLDFPIANPLQPVRGGSVFDEDAFVSVFALSNGELQWSTFLGGEQSETANSVALDSSGNVYLGGSTFSADFPVANAAQPNFGGSEDAFVSKISADGQSLIYSTYFGEAGDERALAITVDSLGRAFIAGDLYTDSDRGGFTNVAALELPAVASTPPFAVLLSADGSSFEFASRIGGSRYGLAEAVAVSSTDDFWVSGYTASRFDFPVVNPVQARTSGGDTDGFLLRIAITAPAEVSGLSLSEEISNATPDADSTTTVTYRLLNSGSAAANDVAVALYLPDGMSIESTNPSKGSFDSVTGTWSVPQVDAAEEVSLVTTTRVDAGGAVVKMRAVLVNSNPVDVGLLDNSVAADIAVGGAPAFPRGSGLYSAMLPTSRSVQVNQPTTVFASMVLADPPAIGCRVEPVVTGPYTFQYQATTSTHEVLAPPDTPVDSLSGETVNYVLTFTPTAEFDPTEVALDFVCDNFVNPAPVVSRLTTLTLSASATPVPDVVTVARTSNNDGVVSLPSGGGFGAFVVATTNIGASGELTVSAVGTGGAESLDLRLCQTDPVTGECINPAVPAAGPLTLQVNSGEQPTFGVFAAGDLAAPFNPAANRIFLQFADDSGVERGATSVAAF